MRRLALLLIVGLAGCEREAPPAEVRAEAPVAPAKGHDVLPAATARTGASLYALDLALTDQHGAPVSLDGWRGHRTIVGMFYTSCPSACPLTIQTIRTIEKSLAPADRDDLRVLLVSFDPARDGPEQLAEVIRTHQLDDRWRLAVTDDESVRVLAAALGIRYRSEGGELLHSTVLTVVDAEGRIVAREDDLREAREALPAVLASLSE